MKASFAFTKAVRSQARLRLGIGGPSGSGKTMGALLIAKALGGRIAVIDSEHNSASLYADVCEFDTLDLAPPYSPERYVEALDAAKAAGYTTVIIDSITHEWNGVGGCLEINDVLAATKFRGNTWSAWSETTPRHRKFVDAMLSFPGHVIVTMRSKTDTAQEEKNGRKTVVKLGMKAEQRDGIEYEFTVVLDCTHGNHFATASKDRTNLFKDPHIISEETGKRLLDWLSSATPEVATPPQPDPGAAFVMTTEAYNKHAEAINASDTKEALSVSWKAAVADCRAAGDADAYGSLSMAMRARKDTIDGVTQDEGQQFEEQGA